MKYNKLLKYFKTQEQFNAQSIYVEQGSMEDTFIDQNGEEQWGEPDIYPEHICFIEDTKTIFTHNTKYVCLPSDSSNCKKTTILDILKFYDDTTKTFNESYINDNGDEVLLSDENGYLLATDILLEMLNDEYVIANTLNEFDTRLTSVEAGDNLSQGTNISIDNNTISAVGYKYDSTKTSFATGYETEANGEFSFAAGRDSKANGQCASAIGENVIADGSRSHAEGYNSHAVGNYSHAEGYKATASGDGSHAEGYKNIAAGDYSHAQGEGARGIIYEVIYKEGTDCDYEIINIYGTDGTQIDDVLIENYKVQIPTVFAHGMLNISSTINKNSKYYVANNFTFTGSVKGSTITLNSNIKNSSNGISSKNEFITVVNGIALGTSSHVEGSKTMAIGYGSHAEGCSTQTTNEYEHAEGYYNKSNKGIIGTISSIGIGNEIIRRNAFEVMRNGDIYINGIGDYDGTNAVNSNSEEKTGKSLQKVVEELSNYTIATTDELGVIKVGENLTITEDGTLSASKCPTKFDELIYSIDGQTHKTLQLLYNGFIVQNDEEFNLCAGSDGMNMNTVFKEWYPYGASYTARGYWGYCDSIIGTSDEESTDSTTLVNGTKKSGLPVFTKGGEPQDYILYDENWHENSGYFSRKKYSNYDTTVAVGCYLNNIDGGEDYIAQLIAMNCDIFKDETTNQLNYENAYGISLHTLNLYGTAGGDGIYCSRPNRAEFLNDDNTETIYGNGNPDFNSTIQISCFKQQNLNTDTDGDIIPVNGEINIPLLSFKEGLSIIPNLESTQSAAIQSRVKRENNIITIWLSNPYYIKDDNGEYVDDLDFKVKNNMPIIINLDNYTLTYTDNYGDIHTKDFSENAEQTPTWESTFELDGQTIINYTENQIIWIREIFDSLKEEAYIGYETKSTGSAFFRYVKTSLNDITILRTDDKKVYIKEGNEFVQVQNTDIFKELKSGSRLVFNNVTGNLFYNDGVNIYQIASLSDGSSSGDSGSNSGSDTGSDSSQSFTLNPATTETLGGIIVGDNLSIDTDGVLTVKGYFFDDTNQSFTEGYNELKFFDSEADAEVVTFSGDTPSNKFKTTYNNLSIGNIIRINGVIYKIAGKSLEDDDSCIYTVDKGYIPNGGRIYVLICGAVGFHSHTEGVDTTASGDFSHAEGYNTITKNTSEHAEGKFNKSNTGDEEKDKTISSIGIGTSDGNRKNAFEVMENGDTFIYGVGEYDGTNINTTNTKGKRLPASIQEVLPKYNKENRSICFHYNETDNSLNDAQSDYSFVIGYNNKAHKEEPQIQEDGSVLIQQAANSFVGGDNCNAYHSNTFTFGQGLVTGDGNQMVTGQFNQSCASWGSIRFIIGGGSDNEHRRNLVVVQDGDCTKNESGSGGVMTWGPVKSGAGWLGDFGEYFEWLDGNPDNEDRIGYMVQLNGDKMELAQSFENCIGVISGTASVIAGSCSLEWHGRFLKDKWGRYLKNEDGQLIENPQYDKSVHYQTREQRPEWDVVGLIGQVITRQDGTLEVGGYAGCSNGIATNATSGFKVLKIIDSETALLLVK